MPLNASQLGDLVAKLASICLKDQLSFEKSASEEAIALTAEDIPVLNGMLHNPPSIPSGINPNDLHLGEWLAACQYTIFELGYSSGLHTKDYLRSVAFGEYDWIQATALETLCRLYLNGKISETILQDIDTHLPDMRHESLHYFAQALIHRGKQDSRYIDIIRTFKSIEFQVELSGMSGRPPISRDELISIGRQIMSKEVDEDYLHQLMELFDNYLPNSPGSGLFYYPENYNCDTDDLSGYSPTVEEVVDKCLQYQSTN